MKTLLTIFLLLAGLYEIQAQSNCDRKKRNAFLVMLKARKELLEEFRNNDREWYPFPWYESGFAERKEFERIFYHPHDYVNCYGELVHSDSLSYRAKHFVLFAMQKASLKDYTYVIKETYKAYLNGAVSEYTLKEAVSNGFFWNNTVFRYKNDPQLKRLFDEIASSNRIPHSVKRAISIVRSTKNYGHIGVP